MKTRLILLILLGCPHLSLAEKSTSFISCESESVWRKWEQIDPEVRKSVEGHLITRSGLSSTGKIKMTGIYRIYQSGQFGEKGDTIALIQQDDLFSDRLFWILLVNITKMESHVVYSLGGNEEQNQPPQTTGTSARL